MKKNRQHYTNREHCQIVNQLMQERIAAERKHAEAIQHEIDKRGAAELELEQTKQRQRELVTELAKTRGELTSERSAKIHYRDLTCQLSRVVLHAVNVPVVFETRPGWITPQEGGTFADNIKPLYQTREVKP